MLKASELKTLMEKHGFSESMRSMEGNKIKSITFMSDEEVRRNRVITPSYACTVTLENANFHFFYMVPKCIVKVETPDCSPVTNEEHFEHMAFEFEEVVKAIYKELGK